MTTLKLMTYSSTACFVLVPLALSLHQLILWRARQISKWLDEDSSRILSNGNMMVSFYDMNNNMIGDKLLCDTLHSILTLYYLLLSQ